jgi:dihydrofolate synthase/folylpolyglutamate synthase
VDYQSALRHVFSLPDSERTVGPGGRPRYDLTRIGVLLQRLGEPQNRVPAVHVTGTKGKGSTCAMIASILAQSGYAVGLYTSPHLHTVRERIRLGLTPVTEEAFTAMVERVWPVAQELRRQGEHGRVTTFELLTAMAFSHFAETERDIQVVEVGLGGTLDATNVLPAPAVCVLTSISLDHTDILGDRVEQIARDKAGIIKEGATVVTAPQPPEAMAVIRQVCQERGARLVPVEEVYEWSSGPGDLEGGRFRVVGPAGARELWMPLLGEHQVENACCALAAVDALAQHGFPVGESALEAGLREVQWPGRLEVLGSSPLVVVDGAHNPHSMRRMAQAVRYQFGPRECILVVGVTRGHDLEGVVAEAAALRPKLVVTTNSRHPRAVPAAEVGRLFAPFGMPVQEAGSVAAGVELALACAAPQDMVLGTGSLFTVAEVREHLLNIPVELYPELQQATLSPRS